MHNKKLSMMQAPFTREEVLQKLKSSPDTYRIFLSLPRKNQNEFLDFCCGKTGIYLCYDLFFKAVFDPYVHPKRLEKLLSALLGQKVEIVAIIPTEGSHMSDRSSFVVLDIVVRLADNTILNVEIQKNGYKFPGQRFDCYCADLIMREYNRLRELDGDKFSYSSMPPVLSIALIETSTADFHKYPDKYIHRVEMKSDTGMKFDNLTQHIYIPLDIFHAFMQNKPIETSLEAWLMLLTTRDLGRIEELIQKYPDFADIYQEIFEFRTKPEELIYMFSKVLLEGDRNMERFMIDELRQEKEQAQREAEEAKENAKKEKANAEKVKADAEKAKVDAEKAKEENAALKSALSDKDSIIAELQAKLAAVNSKK